MVPLQPSQIPAAPADAPWMEAVGVALVCVDPNGTVLKANGVARALLVGPGSPSIDQWSGGLSAAEAGPSVEGLLSIAELPVAGRFALRGDGPPRRLELRVAAGEGVGERWLTVVELEPSVEQLRGALASMPDLLFVLGADGRYLEVWGGTSSDFAAPPEQLLGKRIDDVLPNHLALTLHRRIRDALQSGETQSVRYELGLPKGRTHFEARISPLPDRRVAVIARNVTDEQRLVDRDRASQARLRTLVASLAEGILVVGASGTISDCNRAAAELVGVAPEQVVGMRLTELVEDGMALMVRVSRGGSVEGVPDRNDSHLRRVDGARLPVEVGLSVLGGAPGEFVVTLRDLTEQRRIQRLKDDFISTVSHELRTPLTSLGGAVGLLEAFGHISEAPDARELVALAQTNLARMGRLVEEFLDLDRMRRGVIGLEMQRLDLVEVVRHAVMAHSVEVRRAGITTRFEAAVERAPVKGDALRLTQVVANLLSNATYFTPPGEPVQVRLEGDGSRYRVVVEDRGPGVPADLRPFLFQRYTRDDGELPTRAGTSGLGLAIAKSLVDLHGGAIGLESPGVGARFFFELPALPDAA